MPACNQSSLSVPLSAVRSADTRQGSSSGDHIPPPHLPNLVPGHGGIKPPQLNIGNMSPQELQNLQNAIIAQVNTKVQVYSSLVTRWKVIWYILAFFTLGGNLCVVAMSSSNVNALLQQTIQDPVQQAKVSSIVILLCSTLSFLSMSLNAQLQCNMNVTYFEEATAKYNDLLIQVWTDLQTTIKLLYEYNATYTTSGVGTLINVSQLLPNTSRPGGNATGGLPKDINRSKYINPRPKRYAYPPVDKSPMNV
ncbi:hypothetical protein MP228_003074 [Amoeboaphelidium protococcarum]|nr:hypothetical protein MP228_003074 [Amoeboaphelidium protococcarum]